MKRWSGFITVLLAMVLLTAGFASPALPEAPPVRPPAQEESPVVVDSARLVTEIIGENTAYFAAVSPDGEAIVWGQSSGKRADKVLQLCFYEFEAASKQCHDLSPDLFDGYPYQFQWSPDSRYVAFSENPLQLTSESDIWLFDRETESFANLTDDGLVGSWRNLMEEGERIALDYLPMWNADDGQVYFWRVIPLGNMRFSIGLYRMAPDATKPELVRDLTAFFADRLPAFETEQVYLDGISAIAPDGSAVAVLMTSIDDMGATEQSLWTIDLADESAEPQQWAGIDDFRSALPEWAQSFPPQAEGIAWTGDGAGIVVVSNSAMSASTPFQVYQYVDLASGSITPVVDFSGIEEMDGYFEPAPGSDLPWRSYSPWTASLSPAGDKLLMINDLGGVVALFTSPLPPTGDLPIVSDSAQESPMSGVKLSSRGEDGKVMVYGLLLQITEE